MSASQTLALILDNLRKAAAAHAGRRWTFAPLVLILWPYLHRVAARFERLTQPIATSGRKPADRRTDANRDATEPKPRKPQLPKRFGWLAAWGWDIRCHSSQLRHLLCQPEMRALLEASPQAGRILRPLCRMLGIEPSPELPPNLYPPRPARPPRARPVARPRAKARVPSVAAAAFAQARPRCDRADWWMPKRA